MTPTVLMTMVGAKTSPSLLRAVKENGERPIELIGVDPVSPVPGEHFVDKFETVTASFENELEYIDDIEEILKKYNVDVMLPCGNEDCLAVANHIDQLKETGAAIAISDHKTLQSAFDKYQMYKLVEENAPEIAPKFHLARNREQFYEYAAELNYTNNRIVVKPRHGRGGRGVVIIDPKFNLDEFLSVKPSRVYSLEMIQSHIEDVDEFPELILMEYLPGDVISSYSYCIDGQTKINLSHRRLWGTASNTLKSRIERTPQIDEAVTDINEEFGFEYNINYEFKFDDDGIPKVFDLNPRLAASTAVFRSVGVNLPYLSIRSALGEEVSPPEELNGVDEKIMMRHLTETYINEKTNEPFEV